MSSPRAFNITPRMIHLQSFCWFKQFMEGSILMDTALDNIEFALGSDFDSSEWMDLTYCIVMELGCWGNIKKVWMQQLGIGESSSELHSQPSQGLTVLGNQESSSGMYHHSILMLFSEHSSPSKANFYVLSLDFIGSFAKYPCAWCLMMDWAKDKIQVCQIQELKMLYPAPLVVHRAMESQGVSLMATCAPAPAPAPPFGASNPTTSTSSPGATHRRRLSSHRGIQRKCHKVNASIFIDMDTKEDEEGEEEEEEEEEKEEDVLD
ncbi:hypothetical protein F5141DRAFT_1218484 [Pisolithus sp. B1]|nr:hypothetical protein F5141DRAFT_1218484 [Pisolithus sp. B1]